MKPYIQFEQLSFARGRNLIFDRIDLAIPQGKITAIMGPSGTGKTTLLRLIGGQIKPQSGRVMVDGLDMTRASSKALLAMRRRLGMLFQNGALFTDLTAAENVAFPLREHTRLPESMIERIVALKLQAVGLLADANQMPAALSGGMARRVALARALALDPALMLYDEPFTGQDPINVGVLLRLIASLNQALGLTSVLVSHDVTEVFAIADLVFVINEGRVVASGSPDELRAQMPHVPFLRQFLEGAPDDDQSIAGQQSAKIFATALGLVAPSEPACMSKAQSQSGAL
ncbi:MAG TPA: ABC transporter ATP-binding protein [Halothiobacillus sp.]|nr:MAG: phospholipid ABC transporter ATP-binding protein MlaF [Halothiobacillus sp. 20-54-6]HQT43382.1 ABC transporter ATP-binding protein [Halothiobacillus sp.]